MHNDEPIDRNVGLFVKVPPWERQPEMIQPGRPLDPVRAAALVAAVNLHRHHKHISTTEVLEIAEEFERYLTGTDS